MTQDWHVDGYPEGKTLVPHGMAVVLNNPSVWRFTAPAVPTRHLHCAQCLGADMRGAATGDAGEVLAGRVIELMRATGMPNGLTALGFDEVASRRARDRRRAAVPRDQERADGRRARRARRRCFARRFVTGSRRHRVRVRALRRAVARCTRRAGSRTVNVLPSPELARDFELGLVAQQHVLDDREAEPGAAGRARPAAIDAVEALGQPRNVLRRDADAGVGDREHARAVGVDAPRQRDRAARAACSGSRCDTRLPNALASSSRLPIDGRGVADVERRSRAVPFDSAFASADSSSSSGTIANDVVGAADSARSRAPTA